MHDPHSSIAALAECNDDDIDLVAAALHLSSLFQPAVDRVACLASLDEIVALAQERLPADGDLVARVASLNELIFNELGFAGAQDDFEDPRNSFLDQVLRRRRGLPITLALLYCEVARRMSIPAYGVSFPAHFLVRVGRRGEALILDAYAGGIALDEAELDRRLADVFGPGAMTIASRPSLLRPAGTREILARMCRNLAGVYESRGDDDHLLHALTALLDLMPELPDALLQRGLLLRKLGYVPAAVTDLKRFTALSTDAERIAAVSPLIDELAEQKLRVH
jgi:regulator of sirC expression with transglutaminase-like and TPR domain